MSEDRTQVSAPLARALREALTRDEGPAFERRLFLRHVAEAAAGPLPPADAAMRGAARDNVPLEDAVALAVAVVAQFDAVPAGDTGPAPTADPSTGVTGRAAARELARRVRRRVVTRGRGR